MAMIRDVGVIGLGVIGKPIAERLVRARHQVAVYDVRSEPVAELASAGAIACASSMEVAARSEMIISLVLDEAQTDDVVFRAAGIMHSIKPGALFATGSTLGPGPVKRIAHALASKGCMTLDMPITGGHHAAYEGKLALMVGAPHELIERAQSVLQAFATTIVRAGDVGAGQAAKLAHQLIMGTNIIALLEGLSLGVAGGVDQATLKQIFSEGIAHSTVLEMWDDLGPRWKKMLMPGAPGSALPNLRKDLHTALALAQELNVNLYLGRQASLIADASVATGRDAPLL